MLGIPRDLDTAQIQAAKQEAAAAVYTVPGSRVAAAEDDFGMDDEFAAVDTAADDAAAVAPVKKDKKKGKKKGAMGTVMTIIAIILVVLLIGAGVLYYLKKQKEKASLGVNQVEQPSS